MGQQSRQETIIQLVNEKGYISIEELATTCNVTPQTMRRDINQLAEQNLLRRYHGGAAQVSSTVNSAYAERQVMQHTEKQRIAQSVASIIPNGSSLFINIGTTNEEIAKALLNHQGLKIVTNNLHVAAILSNKSDFQITICGGRVRSRDGGIIGEATIDFVNQFRTDYGIIGISGIEADGSLLDFDYQEVRVAQAIIKNSRTIILAADHTKFGRQAVNYLGNFESVDTLVTDREPAQPLIDAARSADTQLVIAP